jgi:hypothetical protein
MRDEFSEVVGITSDLLGMGDDSSCPCHTIVFDINLKAVGQFAGISCQCFCLFKTATDALEKQVWLNSN